MRFGKRVCFLVGFVIVALISGCFDEPEPAATRPNIVLISIDTLRADHLSCYGYSRATSPSLDRLASDGILFERASSHAPSTLPAHASIFTSQLPQHHGSSHRFERALPAEAETLAEALTAAGYASTSFNGGGQLSASFGLDQGFEIYRSVDRMQDRFSLIAERAENWLQAEPRRPFFLFLHTFEVHQPYGVDSEAIERFVSWEHVDQDPQKLQRAVNAGELEPTEGQLSFLVSHYDAEVFSMDRGLGALFEALKARDLYDGSLIVLTSDHGEELGERGQMATHAHTLHRELLHVPLVVKLPGGLGAGSRYGGRVRGIDVAPTILAAVGLPAPTTFDGRNVLDAKGDWQDPPSPEDPPVISYRDTATTQPVSAIVWNGWKLMDRRLFEIDRDPFESHDVASQHPEVMEVLRQRLDAELARQRKLEYEPADVDEATTQRLRALGYVD